MNLAANTFRVFDNALAQCEQRIVLTTTNVLARMNTGATLANEDYARADLLTSEITAIRRSLEPTVRRVCQLWLRLHGWPEELEVEWEDINLQDEVEEAKAELYREQARRMRNEID